MKAIFFAPLAAYILPTLAIGYGLVIPRSCIAGMNTLSLGFTATVGTAALAYWLSVAVLLRETRGASAHEADDAPCKPTVHTLRWHHAIPATAYVALNFVLGFGWLIPGTCIAGFSEITVGFVMAVATGALTCWAGLLHVRQTVYRSHEHAFAAANPDYRAVAPQPLLYAPLAGYVLVTLSLGYGAVIPGSCIVGFNDLSIGYLVAVLAAALTCWAGIADVLRHVNQQRIRDWATPAQRTQRFSLRPTYWGPLLGYLVFTLGTGFGLALPSSCIAGVNLLSMSFLAAVMFVVPVYGTGVAMALRHANGGLRRS